MEAREIKFGEHAVKWYVMFIYKEFFNQNLRIFCWGFFYKSIL